MVWFWFHDTQFKTALNATESLRWSSSSYQEQIAALHIFKPSWKLNCRVTGFHKWKNVLNWTSFLRKTLLLIVKPGLMCSLKWSPVTLHVIKNKTKKINGPIWVNRTWDKRRTQYTCIDRFTPYIIAPYLIQNYPYCWSIWLVPGTQ